MCDIKDPLKDPPTSPHVCAIDYGGAWFYDKWRNIDKNIAKFHTRIQTNIKVLFQCLLGTLPQPITCQ